MDGSSTMASIDALEKADLMGLLNQMLLYRRFEEKAGESYAIGKIGGFCHLHIGQEAVAAGCAAAALVCVAFAQTSWQLIMQAPCQAAGTTRPGVRLKFYRHQVLDPQPAGPGRLSLS